MNGKAYKVPVSTLVVIHDPQLNVLLLERADRPGFWQSVTGSQEPGESLEQTAAREVMEETGLDARGNLLTDWNLHQVYEIYPIWRHRYSPGTTHNTEHVFGLMVPARSPVRVSPAEHLGFLWLPVPEAAQKVFSWSNRQAIEMLPQRVPVKP
ncbi:dihydroneopterin triphosphate diphosphatase [Betaproteobacteria bacterium GR16-43]|nr:dihydroneopterin triphosphate diphosphatase [Betaproteobacteria bacterium GR16-43]